MLSTGYVSPKQAEKIHILYTVHFLALFRHYDTD